MDTPESKPNQEAPAANEDQQPPAEKKLSLFRRLYAWVLSWSESKFGTSALFVFSCAESSIFPIPPDPLLAALCFAKPKRAYWYAFICSVASVIGGLIGYYIGYALFESLGQWIIDMTGGQSVYDDLKVEFENYSFGAVLLAAVSPIPYKIFTIAAGSFQISLAGFILASILGRSFRFFMVAGLINLFGPKVEPFIDKHLEKLAWLFGILIIGGIVILKFRHQIFGEH